MSDRDRVRRPEPARTEPVRNVAGVFGPGDDPVSRALRASRDVVEMAVRRGFGFGGDAAAAWPGQPSASSAAGGFAGVPGAPWTTGQLVDAVTGAFAQWAQWLDSWSQLARAAMPGGDTGAWPAPQAPVTGTAGTSPPTATPPTPPAPLPATLRVAVELRAARPATVQLALASELSGGAGGALEIHGLLAPPAAAAPPITDVVLRVADGVVTVALGSFDHHPAATYAGAVLAGGRAVGTLTVQLA